MLGNVFRYLRADDWLDSKVPFMISITLFLYLYSSTDMSCSETYFFIGAYFLYASAFLAFSYVINDFADMEIDKKAGKQKVMLKLPKSVVIFSIFFIFLLGTLPMLVIVKNKMIFFNYNLFLYISGAAYSVKWLLRFKERGLIGLIECSVAQRCLPLIPLAMLFSVNRIYFIVFIALSFINGLRYILIHQAVDCKNDIKTSVKTFVSQGNNRYRMYIITAFLIECILFLGIFVRLGIDYPCVFLALILYCLFELIIATVVTKYMKTDLFCTFLAVPLEALYNVFFPVIMAVILTICKKEYWGILVFLIVLTIRCFKGKAAFVRVYIRLKLKGRQ